MNEVHRLENMDLREDCSDNLKFAQLTKAAVKESQRWIEFITGDKFKHHDNFIKSLQDGVLLCRLANSLKAGCIRRINQMQTSVAYLDNLSLFQSSCREDFGLQEAQLFDIRDLDDLDIRGTLESEEEFRRETDRRLRNILVTLYWLGRVARPLRPDAELDLHTFEALVDPSYFDFASFDEPERPPTVVDERIAVVGKNGASGSTLREKICWESKFPDWNNGSEKQVHSVSERLNFRELETTAGNGCSQRLVQHGSSQPQNITTGTHQQISKFIEHDDDDDDEEAPAPPNWDTFPGASTAFDSYGIECLVEAEEGPLFALNPDTSSSSSASSFATKELGAKDPRSLRVIQCLSSPTAALLSASPETLAHDEISDNFERLLRDVEKFSIIRKSQSLKHLEDFDEVGFEEQEANSNKGVTTKMETNGDSRRKEVEPSKTSARQNGIDEEETNLSKTSQRKLERRKSDFMDELLTLDEATRKYDATSSISPCNHGPLLPSSPPASDRTVTLQSPELLERPKQRSAEVTEILRQNSFGSSSSPPSSRKFHSTYMERFAHDLENVLKFEHDGGQSSGSRRRMFDLEQERRRMEEWNKKAEEKLKDKFEKDQDLLKEKLKEDLKRAHQVERMKQLQEEKFLEEEVIEVKNRRSFASENSKRSKFSKSSLSLFAPLPSKTRGFRSASPDLPPTFTSLTDDWLSQSFSSDVEKPSFDDTLPSADLVPGKPERSCGEVDDNDDAFEEPAWMKLKTEKVDKMSIVDVPVNRATIEVLPDSPTTSSESLHSASLDHSVDDFRGTAVDRPGFEADVTRSTLDARPDESASPSKDMEAPPIPDRDDSLLVTSDILTTREQAAYLTFDTSISNFNKSSSTQAPPSFLNLTQSHQRLVASSVTSPADGLLTPSSDRCFEVCRCDPPSTITLPKRTASPKDSISSVFPSPRSPSNDRPDFLFLRCDGSEGLQSSSTSSRSVDHLFAYHDDQLRRRYYWATSPVPSNCVSPVELPSDPKMGSRVNRPHEKASCTGCGYCLATEQTINIYALKGHYHPECFKCKGCDAPLNAENVAIYQSVPHCFTCFGDLSRH